MGGGRRPRRGAETPQRETRIARISRRIAGVARGGGAKAPQWETRMARSPTDCGRTATRRAAQEIGRKSTQGNPWGMRRRLAPSAISPSAVLNPTRSPLPPPQGKAGLGESASRPGWHSGGRERHRASAACHPEGCRKSNTCRMCHRRETSSPHAL